MDAGFQGYFPNRVQWGCRKEGENEVKSGYTEEEVMTLDEAKSLFGRAIRKFPYFECKQLCQDSCGVVCWTEAEELVIADWLEGQNRQSIAGDLKTCVCLYLENGACTIYAVRPIIRRLFGLVKDDDRMICPP